MEQIILQVLDTFRRGGAVDDRVLLKLCHAAARREGADKRLFAKRRLLPFYQQVKRDDPERWQSWQVTPELEEQMLSALRMKPRRSASGVATITVITKPWPCGGDCLFCPNDIRMPKSYLHNEPACERAEQNWFDPYLQVASRLTALTQMGHATDKIELIVLGGTWSDYSAAYQTWFISELFRALNDGATVDASLGMCDAGEPALRDGGAQGDTFGGGAMMQESAKRGGSTCGATSHGGPACEDPACSGATQGEVRPNAPNTDHSVQERATWYREQGFPIDGASFAAFARESQEALNAGAITYNRAFRQLYGASEAWRSAEAMQVARFDELERQQYVNETAAHRVVGLVIETRPDAITPAALTLIRRLGCTKVQMGVQTLDQGLLDANGRGITLARIREAFELLRAFGFKIHAHAMANLLGATPESDRRDYERLVTDAPFQPDEIKLYPCALIEGARLQVCFDAGEWRPYTEEELLDVLVSDVIATPAFCRISRMIRDFSSRDIVAGNKKPNLRQLVENRLRAESDERGIREIRFREVGTAAVDVASLRLDTVAYETTNTSECFLQWVTPSGRIAGFLRLSLPHAVYVREHAADLPIGAGEAMIREVHVYGMATQLGEDGRAAQHLGLGRKLIEHACSLACEAGYTHVNVISAVGTREYYRHLGFVDKGLYQQRELA